MSTSTQRKPGSTSRLILALAVVLLVAGGLLVNRTANRFEYYSQLNTWPETSATIVRSDVIGERAFRPNVVFSYQVNGIEFRDSSDLNMPSFGGRNNRRLAADSMVAAYPVGSSLSIHYNPDDPTEARLKTNPPWSVYGQLGLGIVLILGGVLAGLVSVRLKTNRIVRPR
ncbi:DUF3592 domain-containing protein [candidate division GN15 bacterium]|nr:DUF3592 domain-containing protein [candidate division GN15 bacterium]